MIIMTPNPELEHEYKDYEGLRSFIVHGTNDTCIAFKAYLKQVIGFDADGLSNALLFVFGINKEIPITTSYSDLFRFSCVPTDTGIIKIEEFDSSHSFFNIDLQTSFLIQSHSN